MSSTDSKRLELGELSAWNTSQLLRRIIMAVLFAGVLLVCRWAAYQLRFDGNVPNQYQIQLKTHWHWVLLLQITCLWAFGQFSGIYRYLSLPDMWNLGFAFATSGFILYGVRLWIDIGYSPPKGVILLQNVLGFLVLGGIRSAWRTACERYFGKKSRTGQLRTVAILGAGDAGASLLRDITAHPELGMRVVAFFDDAPEKWRSRVHGVPVIGPLHHLPRNVERLELQEAILAMPSAPPKRLAEVVSLLQQARLKYATLPSIDHLTSGRFNANQLRPVKIEDLLGREPIDLRVAEIRHMLEGRTVMVTGAGGSIGSELCRQVASFNPRRLLLLEQSEVQLFQIEQELIRLGHKAIIQPVIGDILDKPRIQSILATYKPSIIFHAAAHKHVSLMEVQPGEAIKNNAFGTMTLVQLALEHDVERFVMISTDKAVNPTSVMGATKRLAEVFLQSFAQQHPGKTKFAAVRFGNVLGSSGSVVPIFEKQISEGGPVTVTDPEVVRYFMTIPEAVGLVLQSCAQGQGGEIFVLDMGKPVKIAELARQMIRLSGLEPDRDIEIRFIGLRPGEKLYEELTHLHSNCTDTSHPRIKRVTSPPMSMDAVRAQFDKFDGKLHSASADELKRILKSILPEYTPALTEKEKSPQAAPAPADPTPVPVAR